MFTVNTHSISFNDYLNVERQSVSTTSEVHNINCDWVSASTYLRHDYSLYFKFNKDVEYWLVSDWRATGNSPHEDATPDTLITRDSVVFSKDVYLVVEPVSKVSRTKSLTTIGYELRYFTEDDTDLVKSTADISTQGSYSRLTKSWKFQLALADGQGYSYKEESAFLKSALKQTRLISVNITEGPMDKHGRMTYNETKYDWLTRKDLGLECTALDELLIKESFNVKGCIEIQPYRQRSRAGLVTTK
jgi:hypothetical protein